MYSVIYLKDVEWLTFSPIAAPPASAQCLGGGGGGVKRGGGRKREYRENEREREIENLNLDKII